MAKMVDGKMVPDDYVPPVTVVMPSVTGEANQNKEPSKFIVPSVTSDKHDDSAKALDDLALASKSPVIVTIEDKPIEPIKLPITEIKVETKLDITIDKAVKAVDQILQDEQIPAKVRSRIRNRIAQLWH